MQEIPNHSTKTSDIGRTLATERFLNSVDGFWFSINSDIIINPFDFVTVEHIFDTKTIGIVKELLATDTAGMVARAVIMTNTGIENAAGKNVPIEMPVGAGKPVRFANEKEIVFALGVPDMVNPIPSGIIEMTNGLQVPISLDISYLLGPDTAHVNAAGISGNQKTSYLLFLLQSTYQRLIKQELNDAAIIIFNTKEQDLLHIDKKKDVKSKSKKLFDLLDLEVEPFENVTFFLPRGKDGKPNSTIVPENAKTYSYELQDVYDKLELLFDLQETRHNISSILNYIFEAWPLANGKKEALTWSDLLEFKGYPQEVVAHRSTLLYFLGYIQRFRRSPMFTDKRVTSKYVGKEVMKIKPGDIFVVDIAMIPTLEEQSFVVGDVMRNIDEMYLARRSEKKPRYVLIFIDEINRFIPKPQVEGRISPVAEQIMRTVITGRSRGTILFTAQQFKSTVHSALHENTGLHIIAKLGMSELSYPSYSMIDETTKMNIVRLNKGELVMVHPALRHPIRVIFPKASFKKG
ncbi:MAG TPA: hypothetical protein VE199_01040 [Nitrososphaera sp.]|nr:hypothetical protein [Nitrososphaera sp.]